jgi:hypothetical protein
MINEELHVVPPDDIDKHHAKPDCWCQPDITLADDAVLWLHHASSLLCLPGKRITLRTWRRKRER